MDRRLTPANDRAALVHLRGQVTAPHFTQGTKAQVLPAVADLLKSPQGPRDRQLLLGDAVTVIDRHDGYAFVQSAKDGYCGYLPESTLGPAAHPTHWVATPGTHLYSGAAVQSADLAPLSLGARLTVLEHDGTFARTTRGFVPGNHLRVLGDWLDDPVSVAQMFLGTPYLWGGNSRAGLDCSGLVQAALLACGQSCPGDSDLQHSLGSPLDANAPLQRNDLLFWKGHVALVVTPDLMIHANGHTMATSYEGIPQGCARILLQNGGPITQRRRLAPPS